MLKPFYVVWLYGVLLAILRVVFTHPNSYGQHFNWGVYVRIRATRLSLELGWCRLISVFFFFLSLQNDSMFLSKRWLVIDIDLLIHYGWSECISDHKLTVQQTVEFVASFARAALYFCLLTGNTRSNVLRITDYSCAIFIFIIICYHIW